MLTAAFAVGTHLRWQQRVQLDGFPGTTAAEDLRVGISLQEAMAG